ncbi:MAG: diguanylate cyclase [Phycisphaerales bacterium]|nr:diguanylate cyclase [Phycisphaerales bacterium]
MTIRAKISTIIGTVIVLMAAMTVVASLNLGMMPTVIACMVSMFVTVVLGVRAKRSIVASVTPLIVKANEIGRKDLSQRVEYEGVEELSQLSFEFNRLAERIQQECEEANQQKLKYEQELDYQKSLMEHRLATQTRDSQLKSELATKDELTGLHNRREAINKLDMFWNSKTLCSDQFACIMLDIDYFKSFNDTYGHTVGDLVLKKTAELLRTNVRSADAVCRLGGEEFLVICPQSSLQEAAECAEHLRAVVEGHTIAAEDQLLRVTVSLGVAARESEMAQYEDLLKKADDCLYSAKRAGRNRVVVAGDDDLGISNQPAEPDQVSDTRLPDVERPLSGPIGALILNGGARFRKECRNLLESESVEVAAANGEPDVLTVVKSTKPDVILMDAMSSESNLLNCLKTLKTDAGTRDVPVVLIGEENGDEKVITAALGFIDGHITRPLHPQKVVRRLKLLAQLYRGQIELSFRNKRYEQQRRVMSLLIDFSRSLAAALSLNAVLKKTISMMSELTGCRRISIMFPDEQKKNLVIAESQGIDDRTIATLRVPFGSGMAGRAFQSRKSIIVNSLDERMRGHHQEYDAKILVGVPKMSSPLSVAAHSVGVLNISDREGGDPFDAEELEYINQACNMAASAIADNMSRKSRDQAQDSIVEALGKLAEYRDDNTGHHVQRVTQYSVLLAEELRAMGVYQNRITERFIRDLTRSVPLHDIGKVGIPDYILRKPGKLSLEEAAIMKTHVNMGVELIQSVRRNVPEVDYLKMAEEIAGNHHEWYNGTGYPKQLKGDEIPLAARIVALADVYDALRTKRPYKPPFSHAETMKIICELSGMQFDPELVEAFRNQQHSFAAVAAELGDQSNDAVPDDIATATDYLAPVAEVRHEETEEIECYPLAD